LKTFALPASVAEQWPGPRWTADGRSITYILTLGSVSNIWMQPLTGEPPRQLTNFSEDQMFAFAWSQDGKKLACVRGVIAKSVVLMKDFKK
jgi:Tol biopolymer transport system component